MVYHKLLLTEALGSYSLLRKVGTLADEEDS